MRSHQRSSSPKIKATKPINDDASMASTSTFASTASLLKDIVKAKFHSKNKNARKMSDEALLYKREGTLYREASPRAQTAEAYRVIAMTR